MASINSQAYTLEAFLDFIGFYLVFSHLNVLSTKRKKRIVGIISIPLFFFLLAFVDMEAAFIFIPFYYFIFQTHHYDWTIINLLFFSELDVIFSTLFSSTVIAHSFHANTQHWNIVFISCLLEILSLYFLYRLASLIIKKKIIDKNSQIFLAVVQLILLFITYFYVTVTHELNAFNTLIDETMLFIVIELLVMLGLFIYLNLRSRQRYESKLEKQQLDNLQTYTKQLEQSQLKLRKFRHDYKNILLSITELAKENDSEGLISYLSKMKLYSDSELQQNTDAYQDVQNIRDIHVKSLLLNKFFTMEQSQIHYHFECKSPINQINLDVIDIIRLLSILLDNAIEEAVESSDKVIDILFYKNDDNTTEITLTNTIAHPTTNINQLKKAGFSGKSNHSGLGLSIAEDLKQKYPNLFIHFSTNNYQFTTQIIIN